MNNPQEPTTKQLLSEIENLNKMFKRELDSQAKFISKLDKKIKDLEKEKEKLLVYVNNLMRKADGVIKSNYTELRRTQVIDRQKINSLDNEISYLSRRVK